MRLGKALEGQVYAQRAEEELLSENEEYGEQNFAAATMKPLSSSRDMDRKVDYATIVDSSREPAKAAIGSAGMDKRYKISGRTLLYMTVARHIRKQSPSAFRIQTGKCGM